MKAPPTPRPDRADTTAVVQDQLVDLATSTFRPTAHSVLADLKRTKTRLAELQAPIVEELRETLQRLYRVGSLGSTAENAEAAATVYQLAKDCRRDLTYEGQPVALSFSKAERYRTGSFRLRTFGTVQKQVYDSPDFPLLGLIPVDPAAHNPDNPTSRT